MSPIRSTSVLLLFFGLVAACGSEPRNQGSEDAPFFRVQEHLLGDVVSIPEAAIQFQPPVGWEAVELGSTEQTIDTLLAGTEGSAPLMLLHMFRRPENGAAMVVSSIAFPGAVSHDSTMWSVEQRIRTQSAGFEVWVGRFENAGIPFTQFLVVRPDLVTFKLFVRRGNEDYLQFDYILPRASYEGLIAHVESSIGSIRPQ
jgi:hypothetical protein